MALDRDRLRRVFLEEFEEHRVTLQSGLLQIERDTAILPDLLPELFRAAHSLKGGAQVVELPHLASRCHQLEEHLAGLRDGTLELTRELVAAMIEEVDGLAEVAGFKRSPSDRRAPASTPDTARGASASTPTAPQDVPAPATTTASEPRPGTRVPAERMDRLLDHAGEVLRARDQLVQHVRDTERLEASSGQLDRRWRALRPHLAGGELGPPSAPTFSAADAAWERTSRQVMQVRAGATKTARLLHEAADGLEHVARSLRLQPFRRACDGLERTVRDLTLGEQTGGKQARLVVDDGGVELDDEAVTGLREPLLHLVRNAVAHGIEPAARRHEVGKPPLGTIVIAAKVLGDQVEVRVTDDGGGIDTAALVDRARQRGYDVDLDHEATSRLAWLPGLSTAATSDDLSGRGVGLDAVRDRVEQLGGTVELSSVAGQGCVVTLTVPSTLATMHAVLVEVEGQVLALPSAAVRRVLRIAASDLQITSGSTHVLVDGERARVVSLAAFLGCDPGPLRDLQSALLVPTVDGIAVLLVDEVVGAHRITRRRLHPRLQGAPGLLGFSLLASGDAALLVNPTACVRDQRTAPIAMEQGDASTAPVRVLLADDAATTRALERSILQQAGYDVQVAVDGNEAWQLLDAHGADLVVTDVEMPGMDGFELCRSIRDDPRFGDLPVIVVTSRASDEDRHRGIEVGADAYLVKGEFDQQSFLATIARLL